MPKSERRWPPEDRIPRPDESLRSEGRFRSVFVEHYGKLWRYAGRLGVPVGEREDLIQDAFLRVYERREELEVTDALTYTYSVLRNAWYSDDRSRSAKRRGGRDRVDVETEPDELAGSIRSAEEVQISRERREELVRAMGTLPPKMRRCAVLRHVDGLSTREIAEALGIAESTVRAHLHHAGKRLARLLRPGAEG